MKSLYSILICLFLSNSCFAEGHTLYDKGGIKFEYSEYIHKSFYCTENSLMYNLVDVQYTISNSSGKLAYVEYNIDITGLANYAAGCAFKSNKNLDQSSYNLGTGDQTDKISSGDIITGEIGGWIQQGVSPSWNFYSRFYNEQSAKPPAKSNSLQIVEKKNTSNKSDYSVKVDQDDLRVNPEDPNKKANELKKINDQNALEKQVNKNLLNKESQQRIQQEKQLAIENKRRVDEFNKQKEEKQQQQIFQARQQAEIQAMLDRQFVEQQRRNEQNTIDLANAQSASGNAYQEAISNGRKESGAILDATIAGANQLSDPIASSATLVIGGVVSLLKSGSEKRQEKLERQAASDREQAALNAVEERKASIIKIEEDKKLNIIEGKSKFINEALEVNKYEFNDLRSKQRYASLLLTPKYFVSEQQKIYFSVPVKLPLYSDNTYPITDEIEKKLLMSIDQTYLNGYKAYLLYPIIDINKFENDFTVKMGSGQLIFLNAALLKFSKIPFLEMKETKHSKTDFWGNPLNKMK